MTHGERVVGYIRVSTDEQHDSGLGEEAQRQQIIEECERRGWELVRFEEDVMTGRHRPTRLGDEAGGLRRMLRKRPGLVAALDACKAGEASGIVATKLDRLARSTLVFSQLVSVAQRQGTNIVVLGLNMDMFTPQGKMVASILATFAEFESEMISERTKAAMAVAAKRRAANGEAPFGRPARHQVPDELRARLRSMRDSGMGLRTIARTLNEEGVPTATGKGTWHPATVRSALEVEARRREEAQA